MFTGIVEEIGTISRVNTVNNGIYLSVDCKKVLNDTNIGDSIAVNGACQTVLSLTEKSFSVFASYETIKITNFNTLKIGSKVNLERALRLSDRLGGHIVSGHIDGLAVLEKIESNGEAKKITFNVKPEQAKQIIKKGSVTLNGISLTVADIDGTKFSVAVIPQTFENTTLISQSVGDNLNLETDIISKYVEKYLLPNHNSSNIDTNFLKENGFL